MAEKTEKKDVDCIFTLSVVKGDDGGYHAVFNDAGGEVSACRTSLPEILTWSGLKAGIVCNEPPYQMAPPVGYQAAMERAYAPQPPHPHHAPPEPERFPDVIERERERVHAGGMLDRFGMNGGTAAIIAALFMATVYISQTMAGVA